MVSSDSFHTAGADFFCQDIPQVNLGSDHTFDHRVKNFHFQLSENRKRETANPRFPFFSIYNHGQYLMDANASISLHDGHDRLPIST